MNRLLIFLFFLSISSNAFSYDVELYPLSFGNEMFEPDEKVTAGIEIKCNLFSNKRLFGYFEKVLTGLPTSKNPKFTVDYFYDFMAVNGEDRRWLFGDEIRDEYDYSRRSSDDFRIEVNNLNWLFENEIENFDEKTAAELADFIVFTYFNNDYTAYEDILNEFYRPNKNFKYDSIYDTYGRYVIIDIFMPIPLSIPGYRSSQLKRLSNPFTIVNDDGSITAKVYAVSIYHKSAGYRLINRYTVDFDPEGIITGISHEFGYGTIGLVER